MRTICYSVAMSLDGYIAGPRGEYDWIIMDPEIDFMAMMARFDTVLMGRKSFEMSLQMPGGGTMPGMQCIVVSSTLKQAKYPGVTIVKENLEATVKKLRKQAGKEIWLFGGGELFRSLLEIGQVQRVEVAIIPVLLGSGIRFLPGLAKKKRLKLIEAKTYQKTGIQLLSYEVRSR